MGLLANIGLPMISVLLPAAWLALVPIIAIEAAVGMRTAHLPLRRTLLATTTANVFSTILGLPITWILLATVQSKTIGTASTWTGVLNMAWLPPLENLSYGTVVTAIVALSIPMWLMSVLSERCIAQKFFPAVESRTVWRWMMQGNAASYLFLVALTLTLPLFGSSVCGKLYLVMEPITEFLTEVVMWVCAVLAGTP